MSTVNVFQVKFPDSPLVVRADSGKGPAIAAMSDAAVQYIRENIKLVEVDESTGATVQDEMAEQIAADAAALSTVDDDDERRQAPSPESRRIKVMRK